MKCFVLTVAMGGDAFDQNPVAELQSILEKVSAQLGEDRSEGVIRDSNGNSCGAWGFEPGELDPQPDGSHG